MNDPVCDDPRVKKFTAALIDYFGSLQNMRLHAKRADNGATTRMAIAALELMPRQALSDRCMDQADRLGGEPHIQSCPEVERAQSLLREAAARLDQLGER